MTEKRFFILQLEDDDLPCIRDRTFQLDDIYGHYKYDNLEQLCSFLNELNDENEQLKKGMIEVVDRYIRNVEHNPPSSARTYLKVKGALDNVREGLRDLLEDFE